MKINVKRITYRSAMLLVLLSIQGMLAACGQEPETEALEPQIISSEPAENSAEDSVADASETTLPATEEIEEEVDAMQEMFGKDCISDQTFEVQLSEYDQQVYFVPFAPSPENPKFRIQLIQDGQVLEELHDYVPEGLEGEKFCSLDAVAFFDVDFDGNTDILLLETYGDTRFAAIYRGEREDSEEYVSFLVYDRLSEYLTDQVNPLTISEISNFLTGGKKNGEFTSYLEAYEAVSRVYDLSGEDRKYDLIYFDEDDIPELAAGVNDYWVSLFTYDKGMVYCLMNAWAYGTWANAGYEYVPGKSSLRYHNFYPADNMMCDTYMTVSEQHIMELVASIEYIDYPYDGGEATDEQRTVYVNGVETHQDEVIDYRVGEYEVIKGEMSLEELQERLNQIKEEWDTLREMFGSDCIAEQTFEVQLSEFEQEVYFVPFAPTSENPQFQIQLIQSGQVLYKLGEYVPEGLEGEKFRSLDAVAFADVNFDGDTDILLLETYGDTRFAAVYSGERDEWEYGVRVFFHSLETLSDSLSDQVNPLTVSEIFSFLTDGKKNGEFSSYQEAYEAVSRVYSLASENMGYDLIYFDEDDIPELVVGVNGYWMSLFTYDAGKVYCLTNRWSYGAFGIPGYEYVPGKNSLRCYDADMGINVFHENYWTASKQHTMEEVVWIMFENYLDDVNEITGEHCIVYVNGVEIPEDEEINYGVGEYEWIGTELSREELLKMLERYTD